MKSLGQGFLVGIGVVWSFNIVSLFRNGDASLALTYLTILAASVSILLYFNMKNSQPDAKVEGLERMRNLLFSFQGVALGFWSFDLITTFYGINVTGLAMEMNPLGWPLGILGALSFYGPSVVFAYILLFKLRESICVYAAVPLSLLTLGMGTMNLLAGANNFQFFLDTATLSIGVDFGLLAAAGTVCLMVPFALRRTATQTKPVLP